MVELKVVAEEPSHPELSPTTMNAKAPSNATAPEGTAPHASLAVTVEERSGAYRIPHAAIVDSLDDVFAYLEDDAARDAASRRSSDDDLSFDLDDPFAEEVGVREAAGGASKAPVVERAVMNERCDHVPAGLPSRAGSLLIAAGLVIAVAAIALLAVRIPVFNPLRTLHASPPKAAFANPVVAATEAPSTPPPDPLPTTSADAPSLRQSVAPSGATRAAPTARGFVTFPATADTHRVYVDGRLAGTAPALIELPCGRHFVRVGSKGRDQTLSVPCGGVVVATYP
jgi:hypothetical protein